MDHYEWFILGHRSFDVDLHCIYCISFGIQYTLEHGYTNEIRSFRTDRAYDGNISSNFRLLCMSSVCRLALYEGIASRNQTPASSKRFTHNWMNRYSIARSQKKNVMIQVASSNQIVSWKMIILNSQIKINVKFVSKFIYHFIQLITATTLIDTYPKKNPRTHVLHIKCLWFGPYLLKRLTSAISSFLSLERKSICRWNQIRLIESNVLWSTKRLHPKSESSTCIEC